MNDVDRGRIRRKAVSLALAQVCTGDPIQLPGDLRVHQELVDAVRLHRVAPLAHVRLRETAPAIAEALRSDRDGAKAMFLHSAMLLDGLHDVLGDIPWLTFKGPVLSERAHPAPGLRSYNDVDVLVSPTRLRDVCTRLLEAGWQILDRQDMLRSSDTPGEMHWTSPAGVLVDLHWSMINMASIRHMFPDVTEQLLAGRVRVPVGLSSAWTLSPADTLVHVSLHAALTGANRMLLILDADQLARGTDDWDAVAAQAHHWGASPAVSLVLSRARALLGTPLPPDLDCQLGTPAAFRLVTRATDRLSPVPRLRKDASLARLVARSVRPGGVQTLATAGRRVTQGLANRFFHPQSPVPWAEREPADAEALESYLTAVEQEATDTCRIRSTRRFSS